MSLFLPNIPQPSDNLDFSQGQLLSNNQGLDTVFGIDHYKFSDGTSKKGFHNTVTQPAIIGGVDPTTTTNPIIYSIAKTANVGLLQYSRGPSNAAPSAITYLQSQSTPIAMPPNATTNVLDFTGINFAMAELYYAGIVAGPGDNNAVLIVWNGSSFIAGIGGNNLVTVAAGNILQIKNVGINTYNIYWTMQFLRIQ